MQTIKHDSIIEITLLSIEEYEEAKDNIPQSQYTYWWLRSPGYFSDYAACVSPVGGADYIGLGVANVYAGVRPALRVNPAPLNLQIGEKAQYSGRTWTYVEEGILLYDGIICKMPFRQDWQAEDANDYEASDIKPYLDEWLENAKAFQARPNDIVLATYAFDGGFTREEILAQLMLFPADARVVPFVVSGRMEATGFIEEAAVEKLINEEAMGLLKNHIKALLDGREPKTPDGIYERNGLKIYLQQ